MLICQRGGLQRAHEFDERKGTLHSLIGRLVEVEDSVYRAR